MMTHNVKVRATSAHARKSASLDRSPKATWQIQIGWVAVTILGLAVVAGLIVLEFLRVSGPFSPDDWNALLPVFIVGPLVLVGPAFLVGGFVVASRRRREQWAGAVLLRRFGLSTAASVVAVPVGYGLFYVLARVMHQNGPGGLALWWLPFAVIGFTTIAASYTTAKMTR